MEVDEIHKPIFEEVKKMFEGHKDVCHDISHLLRTYWLSKQIQEKEGGDWEILGGAALLHDIHQTMDHEDGKVCSGEESLPKVKDILEKTGFPLDKRDDLLHCVEFHDHYAFSKEGNPANSKEALILQDADNLDAIGAIGVARCFLFGGFYSRPIHDGKIIEKESYDQLTVGNSCLQHFYDKLLKLKENMNTQTAKMLAEDRHKFIESFVEQFKQELPRGEF